MENPNRLTHMTPGGGWAAKIGPGVLSDMISGLPKYPDARLLVGFDTSDDACVYQVREDLAIIQTVDFFPPVVDDPYLFGQIAAANALSDIYAMGGSPTLALNLLCVPKCLPLDVVKGILEGGYSKVNEAGAVVAGGHTIEDDVPKYGLCATGFIHPKEVWSNAGAKAGDMLILTKPLGSGIAVTAAKGDLLTPQQLQPAADSMATLNKYGRDAVAPVGVHACTDVTGFGLLGHAGEMADGSGVTLELDADGIPLLPEVAELAKTGIVPQGAYRNREYLQGKVELASSVPVYLQDILFDPQTSGGLLCAVSAEKAREAISRLADAGIAAAIIGHAVPRGDQSIRVL